MNFVFISPNFPESYRWFCIRLRENGVNVLGVGDARYEELHPDLRAALTEYYKVDSLADYDQMIRALGHFTGEYGKLDWVESNNEFWLELDAALRTDFNITTGLKSDEIVKYKSKSLMSFLTDCAKRNSSRYEMLDDVFYRLHLLDRNRVLLKPEEVPQEYRRTFFINSSCKFLKLFITAKPGRKLQRTYRIWIPRVQLSILAIRVHSHVRQQFSLVVAHKSRIVEFYII